MNFLIEETKFLKKQGKKLTEEDIKSEQAYEKQLQFAQKLEGRYKQLCAEVGEPEKVNITWGQEKVEFKKNVEKAPVSVKPKKITKVSQHWTEDTPDKFQVVMNPKHFENLKEKVRTLKKSLKIKKKQNTAKEAKIADRVDKMKKEGKNLDGKIVEKEKEYELLVKKLNESKKGMKHGALLPLENMIKIKELEDEEGNVIIKVGSCENLIPGDTKVVKENNRIKVRNLKIWYHLLSNTNQDRREQDSRNAVRILSSHQQRFLRETDRSLTKGGLPKRNNHHKGQSRDPGGGVNRPRLHWKGRQRPKIRNHPYSEHQPSPANPGRRAECRRAGAGAGAATGGRGQEKGQEGGRALRR